MLGQGPNDDINGSVGAAEKKFSTNFSETKTKFCLSLHYNGDSFLFVNGKKIGKFKADNENVNFTAQFCYLKNLTMSSQKKYHLKEMLMIFQPIIMLLINLKF